MPSEKKPANKNKKRKSETSVIKSKGSKKITEFDKREIYETKIEPLVNKLADFCMMQRIPFFFACCVANDKKNSEYKYDGNSPEMLGLKLNDQFFDKMLLVIHGFDVETSEVVHLNDGGVSDRAKSMMSDLQEEDEDYDKTED